MKSKLIEVAGGRTKIRVYEIGEGEPLLFLHGAGGLFPDDPFVTKLGERYHVYAPLLPGYEDSEGGENIRDMLGFTLHTFDAMDALALHRPIVVGHSMGGMIAAEMAATAPHAIDRLALIAPAGLWLEEHPIPDIFAKLPFEFPALLFHNVDMGTQLLTAGLDLDDEEFLKEFLITNARQFGMAGKILFPIPERGLSERLYRISAKTAIIWGAEDTLIVPEYGNAFQAGIEGATLVNIPDAGHMVTLEKPDAVLQAISALG